MQLGFFVSLTAMQTVNSNVASCVRREFLHVRPLKLSYNTDFWCFAAWTWPLTTWPWKSCQQCPV